MAFTAHVFTQFLNSGKLGPAMTTDSFKVMLATGTYATLSANLISAQDTAATMTAVKAVSGFSELAAGVGGSNYVLGGVAIASPTYTQSGHVYTWSTATNPSWTTAGAAFNPGFAIFYDAQGGTDATNLPVCWWDFGALQPGTGGNYTLTINASGILTGTVT